MPAQPIVALDIGSTKIACAIGLPKERSSGYELMGTALLPYSGVSQAPWSDALAIGRTIEQVLEATGVSDACQRAYISLSHPDLVGERVQASIPLADEPVSVRARDVERLTQTALNQALAVDREPLLVEQIGYSGQGFHGVRDPKGLPAMRLKGDFHIVTMPLAVRRILIQASEATGLDVVRLSYSPKASLLGIAEESYQQGSVFCIDAGGTSTDLGLFVDGVLTKMAVLPYGGMTLAEQIARDLGVTLEQAQIWSLEGNACPRKEVHGLLESHLALMEPGVCGFLEGIPLPDRGLLSGRAALIDGYVEWLDRVTGLEAQLARSPRSQRFGDVSRQLALTPALGLLEQATVGGHRDPLPSGTLLSKVIEKTKTVLAEYF